MKYGFLEKAELIVKKYSIVFFLSFLQLFLLGSLLTFNSKDASWLYHTSNIQSYKNIFGFLGSNSAAWLIYLSGRAAFLSTLLILYGIISYYSLFITKKIKVVTEWDRALGIVIGFFASTAFCQINMASLYDFSYAGGIIGNYFVVTLLSRFDHLMQQIIIVNFLLIAAILILRCTYFVFFGYIFKFMKYCCNVEKMPARIVIFISKIIIMVGAFIGSYCKKTWDVLSGVLIGKIGFSIVEFEHEADVDKDIEQVVQDLFWQEYVQDGDQIEVKTVSTQHNLLDDLSDSEDETDNHLFDDLEVDGQPAALEKALSQHETLDLNSDFVPRQKNKKVVYQLPNLPIQKVEQSLVIEKQEVLAKQAKLLEEKLAQFDIKGTVVAMHAGPVVTLFEYQPEINVKVSRILSLEDDLAMALRALSIRIIAPIPGRSVVGFEVANKDRQDVVFSTILGSQAFKKHTGSLPMVFGQDTLGNDVIADLAKMPHLLIAGSTGSGKSVALNAMLVSLLCALKPSQLKLIIIDPKRLEFAAYDGIAHLVFPIVTDTKKAIPVLKWVVQTMEKRYETMAKFGVRNLSDYQAASKNNKEMEEMPLMVLIIDELADLMMTAGKAVEDSIARIAQMARAAGIHMIIATQRPSVDVITGMIKVNFPNRVAFKVTSKIDSRTILDAGGAEKLLGRGDMLFLDASKSHLVRVHGAFVSDKEIHDVVAQIKKQEKVNYIDLFEHFSDKHQDELLDGDDDLLRDVLELLKDLDEVSISMLQRRFRIGYNRSARIISVLESKGLIVSTEGGKTRRVVKQ